MQHDIAIEVLTSDNPPVRSSVGISHSVTPGNQTQRQDDTGPSRQEEHTHTQQDRQEGRKQSAEQKHISQTMRLTECGRSHMLTYCSWNN